MNEVAPKISVIVPHYDDLAGLDACLNALCAQKGIAGDDYEIIVSDNLSPVGMEEVSKVVAGRAKLIEAAERGAGPARNAAVAHARGSVLAFTDSDCLPSPVWLSHGVACVAPMRIVGGAMRVSVENEAKLTGAEAFERVFAFNNEKYVTKMGFSVTANLFCMTDDFRKVGPFKVDVSEDKEWCLRARRCGLDIAYAPEAVVAHPARRDWDALRKKWSRLDREAFHLAREEAGGGLNWWLRSLLLPLSIGPHAIRCFGSGALSGASTRFRAVTTLARLRLWRFAECQKLVISQIFAGSVQKRGK